MTVLEVIQRSTDYLVRHGVESPRRNIEELLAHVLKLPRLQLYLNFERTLSQDELTRLRGLVQRRGRREPLQHILGNVVFCGLELAVGPQALVPRPETELLAERGAVFLGGVSASPPRALDFGTGTGCLAIALAAKVPATEMHALDSSAEALALARRNAQAHHLGDRVRFHHGDGFAALPAGLRFDLVVTNPPYVPSAEIQTLQPEVRDHDPRLALDGGPDGLAFYRRLAQETAAWLREGGRLMCEFGDDQAPPLRAIFSAQNWVVEEVAEDYSRRPRYLVVSRNI